MPAPMIRANQVRNVGAMTLFALSAHADPAAIDTSIAFRQRVGVA